MVTRSLCATFLAVLARRSTAFSPVRSALPSSFFSSRVAAIDPTGTEHPIVVGRRRGRDAGDCNATRRHSSRGRSLCLSGAGSAIAPPPTSQATGRWGGGEDGIRVLTREEREAAVASYAAGAKRHRRVEADYAEYMGMLAGMKRWGDALNVKRVGCKRLFLGNFKRGKLCCIAAAEVVWFSGGLSRDVRILLRLIVVDPMCDTRTVGFETVKDLKSFGMQNALLLDLSPLMAVPSLRIFCLASTQTLDEDPEQVLQDPLIQQYNSRVRRSCHVLDDIPKWADLGPYWYEGLLQGSVRFFFRKRFKAVNEYEVTLRRPGPGVSTGSGTVGGARVISIDEAEAMQEIPGHLKVREIERRLSSRLLEEMQGENPVLSE